MESKNNVISFRFVLAIIGLVLLVRLPSIFVGFYSPDETFYATIGQRILDGSSLYVDVVDNKPPLTYLIYALFVTIAGYKAIYLAHAAMVFVVGATSISLAALVQKIGTSRMHSFLTAALYVALASSGKPNDVLAANSELLFNLPIALSFLFLITGLKDGKNRCLWMMAGGVAAGTAIMIKVQSVFPLIATLIYISLNRNCAFYDRLKGIVAVAIGAISPAIIIFAYFFYFGGRLGDALYWMFEFNSKYLHGHEPGRNLFLLAIKQFSFMFLLEQFVPWLAIALWMHMRKPGEFLIGRFGWLIALWLIVSVLAVLPGYQFYGHYFIQIAPPLAIIASFAILKLWQIKPRRNLVYAVGLCALFAPVIHTWIWALPIESFHYGLETYENKKVISYLKDNTSSDETIVVWGKFNGLQFLAGRKSATRFVTTKMLLGNFESPIAIDSDKHWDWFFADMEKAKPDVFVDHSAVDMQDHPPGRYPHLSEYLRANYSIDRLVEKDIIYRRRK